MEHALAWLEPPDLLPLVSVPVGAEALSGGTAGGYPATPEGVRYDGLVRHTPAAHLVAADLLLSPGARAASVRDAVPPGAALARQSALWVHTGRLRPERPAVVVPPSRRLHATAQVHRQRLVAGDITHLDGVRVTTRVRTAVDLLCYAPRELAVNGTRLLLATGVSAGKLLATLEGLEGLPTRRASVLLAVAAAAG